MPKRRIIQAADLFCGAGGTSTGLRRACEKMGFDLKLFAVNHWDVAIATHTANHPDAQHMCASIDTVDPRKAVPGGRLDLLWASPECTFFSVARGGKPVTDQGRASAWLILRWAELLYIDTILIENVKEFRDWCPVGVNGRPMKSRKGETFNAFIAALKSLGYRVEWKVLNAADYGAATTRERLFIQARRGRKPINWPNPSHSKTGARSLFGKTKKWRPAKEVIEWATPSRSIFGRKRPLAPATMARIVAGLEKFGGKELEPFLVILRNNQDAKSIHSPVPAITTSGAHVGLAEPFILPHRMFDATPHNCTGLVEPKAFIIGAGGPSSGAVPQDLDRPLGTVLTENHRGLVQPFVTMVTHSKAEPGSVVRSAESPLSTITTAKGGEHALVQLFLVPFFGEREGQLPRTHSVEDPLPAVTGHGAGALAEPYLVTVNHGVGKEGESAHRRRCQSIEDPLQTVTGSLGTALVEPLIAKYYGTGQCRPVSEPLDTVTAKDRFGLVTPLIRQLEDGTHVALDIHFRMLKPSELARAMSFPDDYQFSGNREAIVKQIGNAVDGSQAEALCQAVLC